MVAGSYNRIIQLSESHLFGFCKRKPSPSCLELPDMLYLPMAELVYVVSTGELVDN
jgi:hypothetical protein